MARNTAWFWLDPSHPTAGFGTPCPPHAARDTKAPSPAADRVSRGRGSAWLCGVFPSAGLVRVRQPAPAQAGAAPTGAAPFRDLAQAALLSCPVPKRP